MTAADGRRCIVCGAAGPLERNHLAARANDPVTVVDLCRPCHGVFTDWQWRLGILRRETFDERTTHGEIERAWTLVEGFVLLALMGASEPAIGDAALALGRATGTMLRMAVELDPDGRVRWGPKPARRRGSAEPVPPGRGALAVADSLALGLSVSRRLSPGDKSLAGLAQAVGPASPWLDGLETHPDLLGYAPQFATLVARVTAALARISEAESLEMLLSLDPGLADIGQASGLGFTLITAIGEATSLDEAAVVVRKLFGPPVV